MVRLHVQTQRRDHADSFLPTDVALGGKRGTETTNEECPFLVVKVCLSMHRYSNQGLEMAKFCGSIRVMPDIRSKHFPVNFLSLKVASRLSQPLTGQSESVYSQC